MIIINFKMFTEATWEGRYYRIHNDAKTKKLPPMTNAEFTAKLKTKIFKIFEIVSDAQTGKP